MTKCKSRIMPEGEVEHVCGRKKNHIGRCKCDEPYCGKTWMRTIRKRTGVKLHPPKDKRAAFVKSDLRDTKWNLQK